MILELSKLEIISPTSGYRNHMHFISVVQGCLSVAHISLVVACPRGPDLLTVNISHYIQLKSTRVSHHVQCLEIQMQPLREFSLHLYKVPRVHFFKSDLQVQYDVISSGDVPVLLLSVASKHEAKVTKEASEGGKSKGIIMSTLFVLTTDIYKHVISSLILFSIILFLKTNTYN